MFCDLWDTQLLWLEFQILQLRYKRKENAMKQPYEHVSGLAFKNKRYVYNILFEFIVEITFLLTNNGP